MLRIFFIRNVKENKIKIIVGMARLTAKVKGWTLKFSVR